MSTYLHTPFPQDAIDAILRDQKLDDLADVEILGVANIMEVFQLIAVRGGINKSRTKSVMEKYEKTPMLWGKLLSCCGAQQDYLVTVTAFFVPGSGRTIVMPSLGDDTKELVSSSVIPLIKTKVFSQANDDRLVNNNQARLALLSRTVKGSPHQRLL